ncbi:hypothetical protein HOO68_06570 [Candidatus Gracilibacteria bacterium]|nr:hypothetical protein [Candidatus Gracilibacteria bacterium]
MNIEPHKKYTILVVWTYDSSKSRKSMTLEKDIKISKSEISDNRKIYLFKMVGKVGFSKGYKNLSKYMHPKSGKYFQNSRVPHIFLTPKNEKILMFGKVGMNNFGEKIIYNFGGYFDLIPLVYFPMFRKVGFKYIPYTFTFKLLTLSGGGNIKYMKQAPYRTIESEWGIYELSTEKYEV